MKYKNLLQLYEDGTPWGIILNNTWYIINNYKIIPIRIYDIRVIYLDNNYTRVIEVDYFDIINNYRWSTTKIEDIFTDELGAIIYTCELIKYALVHGYVGTIIDVSTVNYYRENYPEYLI